MFINFNIKKHKDIFHMVIIDEHGVWLKALGRNGAQLNVLLIGKTKA